LSFKIGCKITFPKGQHLRYTDRVKREKICTKKLRNRIEVKSTFRVKISIILSKVQTPQTAQAGYYLLPFPLAQANSPDAACTPENKCRDISGISDLWVISMSSLPSSLTSPALSAYSTPPWPVRPHPRAAATHTWSLLSQDASSFCHIPTPGITVNVFNSGLLSCSAA
jgi:hypothetical protein